MSAKHYNPSLRQALSGRSNCFGIIRLILAAIVLLAHAFPLGGWGEDPVYLATRAQAGAGTLAVLGFFTISGYLITVSAQTPGAIRFAWRRGLRLLPAYWVALFVSAFAFGPMAWVTQGKSLHDYFKLEGANPYSYLFQNALLYVRQYGVHDVYLTSTPFGLKTGVDSLNGSIWTLIYEGSAYAVVGITLLLGLARFRKVVLTTVAVGSYALLVAGTVAPADVWSLFPNFVTADGFRLVVAFMCGSMLALYGSKMPASRPHGLLSFAVVVTTLVLDGFWIFGVPAFAYLILWLGYALPRRLRSVGATNDLSYGVYLYAWPIQQLTVVLGWATLGYFAWVSATLLLTLAIAAASWFTIERPAMSLKGLIDRMGRRPIQRSEALPG